MVDISLSQVPGRGEVTSMLVTAGGTGGRLVIATGDNNLYTVDLETRQVDAALVTRTTMTSKSPWPSP